MSSRALAGKEKKMKEQVALFECEFQVWFCCMQPTWWCGLAVFVDWRCDIGRDCSRALAGKEKKMKEQVALFECEFQVWFCCMQPTWWCGLAVFVDWRCDIGRDCTFVPVA